MRATCQLRNRRPAIDSIKGHVELAIGSADVEAEAEDGAFGDSRGGVGVVAIVLEGEKHSIVVAIGVFAAEDRVVVGIERGVGIGLGSHWDWTMASTVM